MTRRRDVHGPGGAAVVAVVAATLLWGGTFVVIRDSVRGIDPLVLVFTRFVLAALLLSAIAAALRRRPGAAEIRGGLLGGVLGAAGFAFQAIGLQHTSAGTSAFLTSTGSLFAGVMAWPLLGERPRATLLAGIALATAGSTLLSGVVESRSLALGTGEAWTLLGAVAWGLQIVALARFAPASDALALSAVQAATIAAALAPWGASGAAAALAGGVDERWRIGYLVLAGSTIAPFLQVSAQRALSAGRVGLLLGLEPVFALLFAITVGAERFHLAWWLGAGLILAGVGWVEWQAARGRSVSHHPPGA
jgi:drug/metabolite transporter (DMT)-like permease